jgi:hypothetical protein
LQKPVSLRQTLCGGCSPPDTFLDDLTTAIPTIADLFKAEGEDVRVAALGTCSEIAKLQRSQQAWHTCLCIELIPFSRASEHNKKYYA